MDRRAAADDSLMMQELREMRRELQEMRTRQSEQMIRGGVRISSGTGARITEE